MKNWKKWLVAGCMAALLGIGTMGTTAMAMGGGGVDRSEAVAEEEKVPSGKATQNSRVSSNAWKKINGVCYNGSGQKLEGAVTRGIDVSRVAGYYQLGPGQKVQCRFCLCQDLLWPEPSG